MDVDAIRRHCLSFPATSEKLQWGEVLCFKVGQKMFATLNLDLLATTRLAFKCSPEEFSELLEHEGARPAPYVGRYHWIALESLEALPEGEIERLIERSYQIVLSKAKPAKRSRRTKAKASKQRGRR
jgi:predicted DNA-binding protein (MmcQ/YjbR family)